MSTATIKPALPEWCYPANLLTELRLLAIPAILAAVILRRPGWAVAVFIAAAVSDCCDGWIARHFNQRSSLGLYLDPAADKLLIATLFLALAIVGEMPWTVTILIFLRDLCIVISAAVLYWGAGFSDFRPTWWGKASTTAELATVGVTLLEAWSPNALFYFLERVGWVAVVFLTVVSGIHYAFASAHRYHAQRAQTLPHPTVR
ncbi:MAG: CDP-alcohol phosphatidyltransferase family protein [Terriglobales bacterium]